MKLYFCFLLWAIPLSAQQQDSAFNQEFDRFRQDLLDEYEDFRREINKEYATFLTQSWKEYQLFQGIPYDEAPKPVMPVIRKEEPKKHEAGEQIQIEATAKAPQQVRPLEEEAPEIENDILFPEKPLLVDFYGAKLPVRYDNKPFYLTSTKESATGKLWKDYSETNFKPLMSDLLQHKEKLQMNDYAYYLWVQKAVKHLSVFKNEDSRTVFLHFLLVQSGLDARMARVGDALVVLLPFQEKVFDRSYVQLDGMTFYVISAKKLDSSAKIFTYELPASLQKTGRMLSLSFDKPLFLPLQAHSFEVKSEKLTVKGSVNLNKILFYKDYLSCEPGIYAMTPPDKELQTVLVNSLLEQLKGKDFLTRLDWLLAWVQHGFQYQTDGEQFGFEKPFFLEELFYYPACDCEDRSFLYAYIVNRLLKKETVLLDYPGHMAVAVCVENETCTGDYIMLGGKKYLVCDPTYINAEPGRTMPAFKKYKPQVIRLKYD